jgi:hypothetical protein
MHIQDLVPILQVAITPVILISGVGLLLLTMTNRFGRIIDRARQLSRELRAATGEDNERIIAQLAVLSRRARLARSAIALAGFSALFAAVLIIALFGLALLHLELAFVVSGLFVACMLCLIASLIFFIADINVSLAALKLEIGASGNFDRAH